MIAWFKALLLMPACLAGCLTGLPWVLGPGRPGERTEAAALAGISTLVVAAVVLFLARRGWDVRYLGHSATTWAVLNGIAYGLGVVLMVFSA